jgi:Squalene-hopene cyclase C-terminal domain
MRPSLAPRHDALLPLLATGDPALRWNVGHDLLGQALDARELWALPAVVAAVRRQRRDGAWKYPGASRLRRRQEDYEELETYKQVLRLVSVYRLDRRHPAIGGAAGFLLSRRSSEGDIRGIYGAQYSPNYTADVLRLLIEAGYAPDERVHRGMLYLLRSRQEDGGWAIPARTNRGMTLDKALALDTPLAGDRMRPSSHLVTGIVLRAFAAHPRYRSHPAAVAAAKLLASRFFQADRYLDRRSAAHWTKLAFPFRWTDIVSSLDSIALIGVDSSNPHVERGLRWLVEHQRPDGLWSSGYPHSRDPLVDHWVSFAALRVFARFGR